MRAKSSLFIHSQCCNTTTVWHNLHALWDSCINSFPLDSDSASPASVPLSDDTRKAVQAAADLIQCKDVNTSLISSL